MNKTKLSTLCLALAASLAIPHTGWGCDMGGNFRCETLEEKIQQSDYVFKAQFIGFGVQPTKDNAPDKTRLGRYKISKIWKGKDIKTKDVIIADASSSYLGCPWDAPYVQSNELYYFYVTRCNKKCTTRNQFITKLKCGGIIGLRANLDNKLKLEQATRFDQEINNAIQQQNKR